NPDNHVISVWSLEDDEGVREQLGEMLDECEIVARDALESLAAVPEVMETQPTFASYSSIQQYFRERLQVVRDIVLAHSHRLQQQNPSTSSSKAQKVYFAVVNVVSSLSKRRKPRHSPQEPEEPPDHPSTTPFAPSDFPLVIRRGSSASTSTIEPNTLERRDSVSSPSSPSTLPTPFRIPSHQIGGYAILLHHTSLQTYTILDLVLRVPVIRRGDIEVEILRAVLERVQEVHHPPRGGGGKMRMVMERGLEKWRMQMVKVGFAEEEEEKEDGDGGEVGMLLESREDSSVLALGVQTLSLLGPARRRRKEGNLFVHA
ncbi:hypothetical protein HDV05_006881, partial [Chytridiales sp. JEL 0842]